MFDIGWSELVVIGVVALIVVGPKDLPGMFRTLGRFTARARGMAREFSRAMEDAARDTGLDEAARDLKAMTSKKSLGLDALETAADRFEKWEPLKAAGASQGPETQALARRKAEEARARRAAIKAEIDADSEIEADEALAHPAPPAAGTDAAPARTGTRTGADAASVASGGAAAATTTARTSRSGTAKSPAAKSPAAKAPVSKPPVSKPAAPKPAAPKAAARGADPSSGAAKPATRRPRAAKSGDAKA